MREVDIAIKNIVCIKKSNDNGYDFNIKDKN